MGFKSISKKLNKGLVGLLVGASSLFGNVPNTYSDGAMYLFNTVGSYSNRLTLRFRSDVLVTDGIDSYDGSFVNPIEFRPGVYSSIGTNKLAIDARTNDPTNLPFKIRAVFNSTTSEVTNQLYFSFPSTNLTFDEKYITLQECDTNNVPLTNAPLYNIRDTIANSNGFLNIGTLSNGTYEVNVPYKQFLLWITNAPTYSVNIENGENFGLNPTNFTDIPAGGSITVGVANVYYTNAPGARKKFDGFEKVQ